MKKVDFIIKLKEEDAYASEGEIKRDVKISVEANSYKEAVKIISRIFPNRYEMFEQFDFD